MKIELTSLPESWENTTLAYVFDYIQRGKSPKYADVSKLPIINQKCIRWDGIQEKHLKFWNDKEASSITPERYLKPQDILWNSTGTGTIGRACMFHGIATASRAVADSHVTVLRHNPHIDPTFYFYFIMSPYVQRNIENMQAGSTGQVELGGEVIRTTPAPLAPLNEQKRIVEKIEELFSQIDAGEAALKKAQALIKQYRQSLLKAAVTGELTKEWREKNKGKLEPADKLLARILTERRKAFNGRGKFKEATALDTTQLPELPNGWTWAKLEQLGEFGRGKSKHRPRNDPKLFGSEYPFLQTGTVRESQGLIKKYDKMLSSFGLAQSKLWPKGTLCITIAANIAETGILDFDACFPDSVVGLTPNNYINVFFIEFFIRTVRDDLDRYAPATAQKNINMEILNDVFVPLPSFEEQNKIVEEVQTIFSSLEHLENMMSANLSGNALRQSILKAAFSGQLVPQDPNDEPASALLERIKAEQSPKLLGKLVKKQKEYTETIDRINRATTDELHRLAKKTPSKRRKTA